MMKARTPWGMFAKHENRNYQSGFAILVCRLRAAYVLLTFCIRSKSVHPTRANQFPSIYINVHQRHTAHTNKHQYTSTNQTPTEHYTEAIGHLQLSGNRDPQPIGCDYHPNSA